MKTYEIEIIPNISSVYYIYQPNRLNNDTPNRNIKLPDHFYTYNTTKGIMDLQLILNNEYYPKQPQSNTKSYDKLPNYNPIISIEENDGLYFYNDPNDEINNIGQVKMKIHVVPKALGTLTLLNYSNISKTNKSGNGGGVYGDFRCFYCESIITTDLLRYRIKSFTTNILDKLPEAPNIIGFDNGFYKLCCNYNGGDVLHSLIQSLMNGDFKILFDLSDLEYEEKQLGLIDKEIVSLTKEEEPTKLYFLRGKLLDQNIKLRIVLKEKMMEIWEFFSKLVRNPFSEYLISRYFTFLKCKDFKDMGYQYNGTYLNKWYNPKIKPPKIKGFSTETREFMDQNLDEIDYEYAYILKKEFYSRENKLKLTKGFGNSNPTFNISFLSAPYYFGDSTIIKKYTNFGKKVLVIYSEENDEWFNTNNTDFEGEDLKFEISESNLSTTIKTYSILLSTSTGSYLKIPILNPMKQINFYVWHLYLYPMIYKGCYISDLEVLSVTNYWM
jgi:hypothetical protein